MPSISIEDYQVGLVCALPKEMIAARAMLDKEHSQLKIDDARDSNSYVFGQIHEHNVVIACLPTGVYGVVAAATVASNMLRTFRGLRFGLMVGIGGGIPNRKKGLDIRLGDVVVSQPDDTHGGVVQYDLGKSLEGSRFMRKGILAQPPTFLLTAVSSLQAQRGIYDGQIPTYLSEMERKYPDLKDNGYTFPGSDKDHLHCTLCDPSRWWWIFWLLILWFVPLWRCEVCENGKVLRRFREPGKPVIHYGTIASGNQVVKDHRVRDRLGQEFGAMCVEMEAAGLMNDFPCIVIRGICDYADSHKNDAWQEYAAAVAAAYAKELLSVIRSTEVTDAKHASNKMGNVHWTVTHSVNDLFTGRDEVLARIETALRHGLQDITVKTQRRFIITGMGGQGKSEICLQVANIVRQSFWGVFWVDVDDLSVARNCYIEIAKKMGASSAETFEEGRQILANTSKSWLLILDNADDPHFNYQVYFPSGNLGTIIMTSRNPACEKYATIGFERLEGLNKADARNLLLEAAEIPENLRLSSNKHADEVAKLLEWHPLALIQAGSYIARGHCTLQKYPQIFEQQCRRLLKFHPEQAHSRYAHVYATFEASASVLEGSDDVTAKDASSLLQTLCMFSHTSLPVQLFETAWRGGRMILDAHEDENDQDIDTLSTWHVSHLPAFIQADSEEWDSFRLNEAIHLLASLALIRKSSHSGYASLAMHPLAHAWAKDRQCSSPWHLAWVSAVCVIALCDQEREMWRVHETELRPHLHACVNVDVVRMLSIQHKLMIARGLVRCGWLMLTMRDDSKLYQLLNDVFSGLALDVEIPSPENLSLYSLLARNLSYMGKTRAALQLLERIVRTDGKTLAEDHPSRLASQHVLASAYQANGQIKEAVQLLEHVVKVRETLAEDHPSRLASQHELAKAYQANGQIEEAVQLLEHVVKVEGTLAEDHPSRLASQHELARAYQANGRIKEAVQLLEHVVKVEETLAEDHPSRLASQQVLASAYQANGQIKEAVQLLEHVVKVRETLEEDHPSQLASQHVLASAYEANGQIKEAVQLLEHVVKVRGTLAEDHPNRLASQHELARAYQANGQIEEAVQLLEHVVKVKETLAEDHPSRLASQHVLASAYEANGQIKEAVQLLEHVVKVRETLAEDHPSRLASQHELARAYQANGQIEEAVQLLEHVVKVEETLAEDHPSRLASQQVLASAYQANGQIKEAVQLLQHVVKVEETLAEDHLSRLSSQEVLARAYQANGETKEAVQLLEHVVEIKKRTMREDHPSRLASEQVLSSFLYDAG